ncbi:MAG: GNAT family N-acetyltransferase [Polyangiaceae bacterium]|nr:GNAT family N-acetyltransferase [Polyangiaceae bacterium]
MTPDLENPLWASLTTTHRSLALGGERVLRYPADVAPFIAVADAHPVRADELDALLGPGESAFLLAVAPELPQGFVLEDLGPIVQMVCEAPLGLRGGPPVVPLEEEHRPSVLGLTRMVYPHYFRPRTMELGRYFGILEAGRLSAMVGERMGFVGHREISAVCTHPEAVGRGLARQLLALLTNDLIERGEVPFLHVSPDNTRALALYEQNGYRRRKPLPFFALRRST